MQEGWKSVWSIPYVSVAFFPSLKQNFIAYRSSKVSSHGDWIFEIHQLWQSGCIPIAAVAVHLKLKMYSYNIVNFQESTTILNASTIKVWKLIECTTYVHIYIFVVF